MILVYHRPHSKQREKLGMPRLRCFIARWDLVRPYLVTSREMVLQSNESVLIIGLDPNEDDVG